MSNQPKRIDSICKCCNEIFRARLKDVLRGYGLFCSLKCKIIYQMNKENFENISNKSKMEYLKLRSMNIEFSDYFRMNKKCRINQ